MTTTLGINDRYWTAAELSSAMLLGVITARTTYSEIQKQGAKKYFNVGGDFWTSAQTVSSLLVTGLLIKGAIDAAKSYGLISGIGGTPLEHEMKNRGFGAVNYF